MSVASDGIYLFENTESLLNKKLPDIPFYINTISNYKGDTSNVKNISIPYSNNRLVVRYSAVSFNSYETVKYFIILTMATLAGTAPPIPELILENLEPGSYKLQIKAVIPNQQRQSANKSFFTIEKPWWQNNWIRLLTVILLLAAVYAYIIKRVRKIKSEEKKKTDLNAKLSELEQTALRSQMNPHFIFNCLTSIQQLIVSGNKTDANEYLVKFARLIRKTLDLSAHPFISIREETEYLTEYLLLEQLRLSGQFKFMFSKDETINVDKTYIPNMMLQPVVENCIRHGIKSLENKKGMININFQQNKKSITCTITDNGVGRTEKSSFNENAFTKHKSYGVDIVRKRLQAFSEFNNQDTGIEINDLLNASGAAAGTQVILHLPFKKMYDKSSAHRR
ncbi:MAG: histidine kinase [Chitinophagaceae bacterium]|nr:histidine kinase [Chitinophagaceae bacterium]